MAVRLHNTINKQLYSYCTYAAWMASSACMNPRLERMYPRSKSRAVSALHRWKQRSDGTNRPRMHVRTTSLTDAPTGRECMSSYNTHILSSMKVNHQWSIHESYQKVYHQRLIHEQSIVHIKRNKRICLSLTTHYSNYSIINIQLVPLLLAVEKCNVVRPIVGNDATKTHPRGR